MIIWAKHKASETRIEFDRKFVILKQRLSASITRNKFLCDIMFLKLFSSLLLVLSLLKQSLRLKHNNLPGGGGVEGVAEG
jgi:hypothetical protein